LVPAHLHALGHEREKGGNQSQTSRHFDFQLRVGTLDWTAQEAGRRKVIQIA
jgi:hypothetical protein